MRLLRALVPVLALLAISMVQATSVSADPGGSSFNVPTTCISFGSGYSFCYSEKGEANMTQTPSGNSIFESNVRGADSATVPGFTYTDTYALHSQTNVGKESHFAVRETVTENGYSFCITDRFHATQSGVQFDNSSVTPGAC